MSKLTDRIHYIYHHRPHPFNGLWEFAKGHLVRWQALRHWAARKGFQEQRAAYAKKVKWLKEHADPKPAPSSSGIVTFDGKPCAAWIANILKKARASGTWNGTLISGYRSPEYSQQLCYGICGAPSCPGRCAGVTSNHTKYIKPGGAADVTDPAGLQRWCQANGNPLHGNGEMLPSDPVHFSADGH